jgi:hypothetical protein
MMMQLQQVKIWDYSYFRVGFYDRVFLLWQHHRGWKHQHRPWWGSIEETLDGWRRRWYSGDN